MQQSIIEVVAGELVRLRVRYTRVSYGEFARRTLASDSERRSTTGESLLPVRADIMLLHHVDHILAEIGNLDHKQTQRAGKGK